MRNSCFIFINKKINFGIFKDFIKEITEILNLYKEIDYDENGNLEIEFGTTSLFELLNNLLENHTLSIVHNAVSRINRNNNVWRFILEKKYKKPLSNEEVNSYSKVTSIEEIEEILEESNNKFFIKEFNILSRIPIFEFYITSDLCFVSFENEEERKSYLFDKSLLSESNDISSFFVLSLFNNFDNENFSTISFTDSKSRIIASKVDFTTTCWFQTIDLNDFEKMKKILNNFYENDV